jgi:hypothetical protein
VRQRLPEHGREALGQRLGAQVTKEPAQTALNTHDLEGALRFRELHVIDPDDLLARSIHNFLIQNGLAQRDFLGSGRDGREIAQRDSKPDRDLGRAGDVRDQIPGQNPFLAIGPPQAELGHLRPSAQRQNEEIFKRADRGPLGVMHGAVPELREG